MTIFHIYISIGLIFDKLGCWRSLSETSIIGSGHEIPTEGSSIASPDSDDLTNS